MKKGLVLEGGAMRGMFTCGVLDVFLEEGVEFDGAVQHQVKAAWKGTQIQQEVLLGQKISQHFISFDHGRHL